jgi:SAM-dependent methyltransferase
VQQQEAGLGMRQEGPAGASALRLWLEQSPHFAFLRDFLRSLEFNEESICRRVGMAGLNEFLSNERARVTLSGESDGLGFLIRLFLLGELLGVKELESVIPTGALEAMKDLGLLIEDAADHARVCASVALYPVGRLFIVSDRWSTPEGNAPELPDDFVFPAITANTSQFMVSLPRDACESFLELCSGTGVAALEAARQANHAWAVDITERSTQTAEFNRLFNGFDNVTTIQGDLYECLGDLTFDRIVAHPPYMPVLNRVQIFYDGGSDGEQVTRRIVMGLPRYLRPGGCFYCLAQGSDREGAPFEQRVRAWLGEEQSEFDVMVIVRQPQNPEDAAMQYAVKSRGGGQAAHEMREALRGLGIQLMVYGWMIIQRRQDARPVFTTRKSTGPNTGRDEIDWLLKWETAAAKPRFINKFAEMHPVPAPSLELHVVHRMKEEDLAPEQFSLRTEYPFSVDCRVQPWMGFLLPQCDGKLRVRELLEFCRQNNFVHPETPLAEFVKLLMVFISGGFLEVEGFKLPKRAT